MSTFNSILQQRGNVTFPTFTEEHIYMRRFLKREGLPFDLARWQPTVDDMLVGIEVDGPLYLMVDQSTVIAGNTQRRPGLHIDGYWCESIQAHGQHRGRPGHIGTWDTPGSRWKQCDFEEPEAILLASDVSASRALIGEWEGTVGEGGDCSSISTRGLQAQTLKAGRAYAGNVTMLHESLPVAENCKRTLVRINVPGWEPKHA
jgi:hypothetical protein